MSDITTDLPVTDQAEVCDPVESNPVGLDDTHGKPGQGHTPVTLCHNGHTITVDDDAVPGHLGHHTDDYLGECVPVVTPEPPVVVTPPVVDVPPPVVDVPVVPPVVEVPVVPPVVEAPVAPPKAEVPVVAPPTAEVPPVVEVSNPVELPLTTPVVAEPVDMAPCTEEDGSAPGQAFPCSWDASLGNGSGCSFVLDYAGDVSHYVDAACAPVHQAEVSVSTVSNPVGLAETGSEAGILSGLALALVVIGIAAVRLTRRATR
jgi:hypothetical protein